MRIRKFAIGIAALGIANGALAQDFFDFDEIPGAGEPTIAIDLGEGMLGFVVAMTRETDPAAADIVAGLRGIRVRVYEALEDAAEMNEYLDDTSNDLERSGWERIVFVQEDDEKVRVYARMDGQSMSGMTIMIVDGDESVFINIDGAIDPAQLGRIASGLGMGGILTDITGLNGPRTDE